MDEEENQDQLINRNTSQGRGRPQGPFVASDDDDIEESDGSGSDEEDDMEEEDGEEEEESGSEEEDEDEGDLQVGSSDPTQSAADLIEAMSSDEERENCPICLNGFRDQVVGTPENCNHYFCLDCIAEWSKNANSCPVDRITFSCIHIRAHYGGEILKKVPIHCKANEVLGEEEDTTNCEVCGRSDREDRLLLCDGCDAGYHMECLTPPLNAIPVDEWFCPECAATNQAEEEAVSEEEVSNLLADVVPTTSRLRTNVVRTRAIARTRQSERVRANVNRIRTTVRTGQNVPRYLLSSLLDETIEAVVAGLNTAVYQRNLAPRTTTTTRRRRRTVKKTGQTKVSKGSRGVRKRRKRRVKRRKGRKQTTRKVPTSQSRIARSLGMCSPQRGSSLPRMQRATEQTLGSMRHDIGAASLSVFGNPYDLDPFDSNDDQISNPLSPLTAKRRVLSRSALRSHQPVARPISVGLSRVSPMASGPVAVAEPVPDLLGSILSGQSMLMMKSSDIVISRDGSLTAKKSGENSPQNSNSREDITTASFVEPSPSHSGSPTISSSPSAWKPVVQQSPVSFPSSDLYALSPAPSPPPASSSPRGLDRLSLPNSSMLGISPFRLKNAFTPRVVQVQSSAGRLTSKGAEPPRVNGALHKPESPSLSDPIPPKPPEIKHPSKPPAKRLEISEFPRIPKIKKETDTSSYSEGTRRTDSASSSTNTSLPRPGMNQLTGRGESKQVGRFSTTENTEKNTRQESQAPSRHCGGISSSHAASSNSKAPLSSNSSRNVGSSDSGGGGLRITISAGSTNSCRQFSPSTKDPFRTSDGKSQQKTTLHNPPNNKREKTVKNEIYDPFEPTGSDSGSRDSSPERPTTSPLPTTITENPAPTKSSGVKVGAFRSFKLTTHARVGVSKLGPDFSGMSPNNKESQESKSPEIVIPVSPPPLKVDREIKMEIKEEKTEHTPFRISCPLSGLKITSDLKTGGSRGFHFDLKDQPKITIKSEPDILLNRTFHPSSSSNRVVWEAEDLSESRSLSINHSSEPQKKIKIKEEPKSRSRSRSRTKSRERDSRSASLSPEDREREKKYKSKSHKVKRSRSDRSSSGSCERSKKKRQKEKKKEKEKKKKNSESKERKRSRSSSRSSSSLRTYNSKKKKKKKRDSRSDSVGRRSLSPEKEKKRKRKSDKSYSSKEGSSKVKDKKKPKEERAKPKSRSQPMTKELKSHKSKEKSPPFRDQEVTRHIVLSPNNNETTITCTVNFKSESPTVVHETKSILLIPKVEALEKRTFQYLEDDVSVKEDKNLESSDHEEEVQIKTESPPWSPSLLDSLVPEEKEEDIQEPPSPQDSSPSNDLLGTSVVSPQASSLSTSTEPASPKSHSAQPTSRSTAVVTVKKEEEEDDLQWSPSHLDDFLLNELSDDVCSVGAASPDDVDLEEAILMKSEEDCKETTVINFSKKAVIPFLQDDDNLGDGGAGNHIDEKSKNSKNSTVELSKSDGLKELSPTLKSKPQIKRVTWNLHQKDSDKTTATTEESVSSPSSNVQSEAWATLTKFTVNQDIAFKPDPSSETSSPLTWNTPDTSSEGSVLKSLGSWSAENRSQNNLLDKPEDKPVVHTVNKPVSASVDRLQTGERLVKDGQIPWITTDTPVQVFPQTLPPLPLPPVFPPYAPLSQPTVPCVVQSSRTMPSQTPKPGSLATANEPKMQAASTGKGKGKSKPKTGEKVKNEEYMKKLHMQERAVEEVKLAIKPFYQKREITKDEYKEILRKAVQKICHSKSGEINPVKVVNLVKGYVERYKHIRNKQKKSGIFDDHDFGRDSPI